MNKLFYFLTLFNLNIMAQNLVPNPSFEDFTICPFGSYQIDKAINWSSAGGSPDYFNSCASPGGASVPLNFYGFQNDEQGNGYVGLYIFNKGVAFPNNREHIQASLTAPLTIGTKYYVAFDVSFTLDPFEIGYAADKLGILFTNVSTYNSGNPPTLNNSSHVFIDTIITDTMNWYHFTGNFIADSAYQNVIVGNFFTDFNTDTIEINNSLFTSYYYVDNICVSSDSLDCLLANSIKKISAKNNFEIYPNPSNNEFIYIQFNTILKNSEIQYTIFNSYGMPEITESTVLSSDKFQINLKTISKGIYFLQIKIGQQLTTKKIILN